MTLVSVIIPSYKSGQFIATALESVGSQSHADWEAIVVDDGGPEDGTRDTVELFARKHPGNRVAYIRHPENAGVSAARNTAVAESRGSYLALLDPDDRWLPQHLENSVRAFDADQSVAVCSAPAYVLRENSNERDSVVEFYDDWERQIFPCSLGIRNALPTSASVISRTAFEEAGGFDESPDLQHIEDYDLWLRIAARNRRFVLLVEPGACYRKHSLGVTSDSPRMQRLKQALAAKHMPYLFSLQKVALEDIALQFRDLSRKVRTQEEVIERQGARIRVLENTVGPLIDFLPIRVLRYLRQSIRRDGKR